jgi:hypothetical protein
MSLLNRLVFIGRATKEYDGEEGLLFLHVTPSGSNRMIFPGPASVKYFMNTETDEGRKTVVTYPLDFIREEI